jgi:hypothetical protein
MFQRCEMATAMSIVGNAGGGQEPSCFHYDNRPKVGREMVM